MEQQKKKQIIAFSASIDPSAWNQAQGDFLIKGCRFAETEVQ
ncbi:hypothetical protein [Pajaroellobacter abortibovis]|nr:hypothetical protein [Pajaroellobacter abortibovis]